LSLWTPSVAGEHEGPVDLQSQGSQITPGTPTGAESESLTVSEESPDPDKEEALVRQGLK